MCPAVPPLPRHPEIPGTHFLCDLTDAFWDAANRILHPYRAFGNEIYGCMSCVSTTSNLRVILRCISPSLSLEVAPWPREEKEPSPN